MTCYRCCQMSRPLENLHCPECNSLLPSHVVRLSGATFTCPDCGAGLTAGSGYAVFWFCSSAVIATIACYVIGGSIVVLVPLWFVMFSLLHWSNAFIARQLARPNIRFSEEYLTNDDPK